MTCVRTTPRMGMMTVQNHMDRFFEGFLMPLNRGRGETARQGWNPAVDVYENDAAFLIKAELPGVDKKDIVLDVKDHVLTLKGERSSDEKVQEDKLHRQERFTGKYQRAFSLPPTADSSNIEADYKDGVLTITIPKAEVEKPKQISIH